MTNHADLPDNSTWATDEIQRRGIDRLCHFTAIENLDSILTFDLWDRAALDAECRECNSNDTGRYDSHSSHICCSIQYPNTFVMSRFEQRYPNREFIILCIDPIQIANTGTKFAATNAASGEAQLNEGAEAFRTLFAPVVTAASGIFTRGALQENCPTDAQAEVLIPGPIGIQAVHGVVVRSKRSEFSVKELLSAHGFEVPVKIEPRFFTNDLHNVFVRTGKAVKLPGFSVG